MNSKEQQTEFAYKIGLWLRPVLDVIEDPTAFDDSARRRIRAQFAQDWEKLEYALGEFCREEMGVGNSVEWQDVQGPLARIHEAVRVHIGLNPSGVETTIEQERPKLLAAIAAVPVSDSAQTFDAATPFSTYCKLKPLFCAAAREVVYTDRYAKDDLFFRYLRDVANHVAVSVVVSPRKKNDAAFMDVSRLYATGRGPTKYRLLEEPTFHDRILKIDDGYWLLGGSIGAAGHKSSMTIATVKEDPTLAQKLQNILMAATELFGPNQTTHP